MPRVVLITLIALCAAPAPSFGQIPRDFVGTTAYEDPSAEEFERMSEAVGFYRSNLYWPAVEPLEPGLRDWSRYRSEEHTSELQSLRHLVCRLLLEKKKRKITTSNKSNS